MKIMHGPVCTSVFFSVCVFNVWPMTTPLPSVWPRDAKRLETPGLEFIIISLARNLDSSIICS